MNRDFSEKKYHPTPSFVRSSNINPLFGSFHGRKIESGFGSLEQTQDVKNLLEWKDIERRVSSILNSLVSLRETLGDVLNSRNIVVCEKIYTIVNNNSAKIEHYSYPHTKFL